LDALEQRGRNSGERRVNNMDPKWRSLSAASQPAGRRTRARKEPVVQEESNDW